MTPRENLLQTLRCENPQWIPVSVYLVPNENPSSGIPNELRDVFNSSWGDLGHNILKLGEYWGAEDFQLPVPQPATLISSTCSFETKEIEKNKFLSTISTSKGMLRQITEVSEGHPALVTERYVKNIDDVAMLIEYFSSLHIEIIPDNVKKIKDLHKSLGNRGILFYRTFGTPLGMCYRVYSDILNLVYMITDAPEIMEDLFACMEEKYFEFYEFVLREVPEIDAYFGMDDTSTTLISPTMFETFNVKLINKRADLCHKYGKIYMHHSCGLIHDLLPIYRKTRMDGVDAFTVPPIGNVSNSEGRELLGTGYSMNSRLASGLQSLDKDVMIKYVRNRFEDAKKAGSVAFYAGGANLTFSAMEFTFSEAQKHKR